MLVLDHRDELALIFILYIASEQSNDRNSKWNWIIKL